MSEETIVDALKWVEALINHYQAKYADDPNTAFYWILSEIRTCIMIGEFPDNDGTRFKEATEQLNRL